MCNFENKANEQTEQSRSRFTDTENKLLAAGARGGGDEQNRGGRVRVTNFWLKINKLHVK